MEFNSTQNQSIWTETTINTDGEVNSVRQQLLDEERSLMSESLHFRMEAVSSHEASNKLKAKNAVHLSKINELENNSNIIENVDGGETKDEKSDVNPSLDKSLKVIQYEKLNKLHDKVDKNIVKIESAIIDSEINSLLSDQKLALRECILGAIDLEYRVEDSKRYRYSFERQRSLNEERDINCAKTKEIKMAQKLERKGKAIQRCVVLEHLLEENKKAAGARRNVLKQLWQDEFQIT